MPAIDCTVNDCWKSRESKHRFPNPVTNRPLFDKWVNLCGNKRLVTEMTPAKIYSNCRICALHFLPEDFGRNRTLKKGVFPSVRLPGPLRPTEENTASACEAIIMAQTVDYAIPSTSSQNVLKNIKDTERSDRGQLQGTRKNPLASTLRTPSPPRNTSPELPVYSSGSFQRYVIKDYSGMALKIKHLSAADDGIKFNQKIKYIVESWSDECKQAQQVVECFDFIHDKCLEDAELASKLVLLISSRSFLTQEICKKNIRFMFLQKLQDNFECRVTRQQNSPSAFRNTVLMMCEFYNKARMINGQQLTFLADYVCIYLNMLLESAKLEDLTLFVRQLYLNGASLTTETPEQMSDILNKARLILCTDRSHNKDCKLWLLLALDLASNKFSLLPAEIHKFYVNNLNESSNIFDEAFVGINSHQDTKEIEDFKIKFEVVSDCPNPSLEENTSSNYPANIPSNTDMPDTCQTFTNSNKSSNDFGDNLKDDGHIQNILTELKSKMKNRNQSNNRPRQSNEQRPNESYSHTPSTSFSKPKLGINARLQRQRMNPDIVPLQNDTSLSSNTEKSWKDPDDRINDKSDDIKTEIEDNDSR